MFTKRPKTTIHQESKPSSESASSRWRQFDLRPSENIFRRRSCCLLSTNPKIYSRWRQMFPSLTKLVGFLLDDNDPNPTPRPSRFFDLSDETSNRGLISVWHSYWWDVKSLTRCGNGSFRSYSRSDPGSFRSYSLSVRSFRPGSFRPDFRGGSFRSSFGGLFRPTLFYMLFRL